MSLGEYISGIITVSAGMSLAVRLLPDKSGGDGLRHSVTQVMSLILTICLVAPLAPLLGGIVEKIRSGDYSVPAEDNAKNDLSGLYAELGKESGEEICHKLREMIAEKFEISEENITVYVNVTANEGGVSLDSVTVCLTGKAAWQNPHQIIEYVSKIAGCPCEVVTGRG